MTGLLTPYSVAEVRDALRALREAKPTMVSAPTVLSSFASPADRQSSTGDLPKGPPAAGAWVAVIAAQPASGASTVALALVDAVASARPVCLVEVAPSTRSGLAGCAIAELGVDGSASWRRGTRGGATILRRATGGMNDWPDVPVGSLVVADLGVADAADLDALAAERGAVLAVCRASIPGLRAAEQLVTRLPAEHPAAVAAVGATRLARTAIATLGSRLRQLDAAGRLLGVPDVPSYRVTGPTAAPLPSPIATSGVRLAELAGLIPNGRPSRRRLPRIGRTFG